MRLYFLSGLNFEVIYKTVFLIRSQQMVFNALQSMEEIKV